MTTVAIPKQKHKKKTASSVMRIAALERQMAELRSAVSRVVVREDTDPEGEYRPEFVKEVLASLNEKPTYRFTDKKSFLKQLREV